jgi:deoxycytidine triphosphate deaminase
MILSRKTLLKEIEKKVIQIDPFNPANLKAASYTYTLGPKILKLKEGQTLQRDVTPQYDEIEIPSTGYKLNHGEFIVGYTNEKITLNGKYASFLASRGSCARIGLSVLLGDNFAEPDTDSVLSLGIQNVSQLPIVLLPDMLIVKGIFHQLA